MSSKQILISSQPALISSPTSENWQEVDELYENWNI